MPDNVWDLVFKPEYISKLKDCGVCFLDSATEIVPPRCTTSASPFSRTADYTGVAPLLKSIRPYVTLFSSSGYINDMASGSICVALGWSGDINIARQRAIDGKTGQKIEALLPKTGVLFFDVMVIGRRTAPRQCAQVHQLHAGGGAAGRPTRSSPTERESEVHQGEVAKTMTVFSPDDSEDGAPDA
jgi:putrescine transport system substrate-binding protein